MKFSKSICKLLLGTNYNLVSKLSQLSLLQPIRQSAHTFSYRLQFTILLIEVEADRLQFVIPNVLFPLCFFVPIMVLNVSISELNETGYRNVTLACISTINGQLKQQSNGFQSLQIYMAALLEQFQTRTLELLQPNYKS